MVAVRERLCDDLHVLARSDSNWITYIIVRMTFKHPLWEPEAKQLTPASSHLSHKKAELPDAP